MNRFLEGEKMFCTKCGAELVQGDRFCTGCGAQTVGGPVFEERTSEPEGGTAEEIVAVPVQLRTGMLKTQIAILLFGASCSALIHLDKKQYESIVASGNTGGNYFQKVAGMMTAFGEYAKTLEKKPVRETAAAYPGSILFDDAQVKRFKIWNAWDTGREQYNEYYSFELLAGGQKYKGTLERNVNAQMLNARLRGVLGGRIG